MRKIITSVLVLVTVVFAWFNVNASEWYTIDATIEKAEDSRELYNSMPTSIKKNDTVTVKLLIKNAAGWKLGRGERIISWDKEAFELLETNGKYYSSLNANVNSVSAKLYGSNSLHLNYYYGNDTVTDNNILLLELKFKVKNDVRNGIYQIRQEEIEESMDVTDDSDTYHPDAYPCVLQYEVGKSLIKSSYTRTDIENIDDRDIYIIGSHLFTRNNGDEGYEGTLTTEYIMLASKTIESDDKDAMVIYIKDAFGDWKNAITNEIVPNSKVPLPDEFNISYIDMKANYAINGVYSSNDDAVIMNFIQFNKDEALITIEKNNERIHGIASMNNGTASLIIGNKTYQIIVTDSTATIKVAGSSDISLQKRTNRSINDYYNSTYFIGYYGPYEPAINYLNSSHNGKYVSNNYELYLVRADENTARVCIRQKNQSNCIVDSIGFGSDEATYFFDDGETGYGINWTSTQIQIACLDGNCTNAPYTGTFTREKSLTMDDIFHIWEKNTIEYKVTFNLNNGNDPYELYVVSGNKILDGDNEMFYYEPYKENYLFAGWTKNGEPFDIDSQITGPITLEATYRGLPGVPELTFYPQGVGHDYYSYENGLFLYKMSIELDEEYDGFDIFDILDPMNPIGTALKGNSADVFVPTDAYRNCYAKAYVISDGSKVYGAPSTPPITIHPQMRTVTFDSNGGSAVPSQTVPYGEKIVKPEDPTRSAIFAFDKWVFNNQEFDFNSGIDDDMTLVAVWQNTLAKPVVGENQNDDFYTRSLYLYNYEDYCTSLTGCNFDANDHYLITGYEVYKKVNNEYQKIGMNIGTYKTQFAPYEYFDLEVEPNETNRYVIRAFAREGADVIYSSYSDEYIIDTTYVRPEVSFNPNGGVHNPNNEVENWIVVSNLVSDYGYYNCDENGCESYKITGFEVFNKVGNEYNSLVSTNDLEDPILVTANYGQELHLYVVAYASNSNGYPVYSDYSDELVLYEEAPADPLCYVDGSNEYHWTNTPDNSWSEVSGVTTATDCHAPYMCYVDGSDEYHWSYSPEAGWNEVPGIASVTDCHAPVYVCYKDGDDGYHWATEPETGWEEVVGVDSVTDCHAPSGGGEAACYIDPDLFEYHWTDNPDPNWVPFPGITDEVTCQS